MCLVPWRTIASCGTTSASAISPTTRRSDTAIPGTARRSVGHHRQQLHAAGRGIDARIDRDDLAPNDAPQLPTRPITFGPTARSPDSAGDAKRSSSGSTCVSSTIGAPASTYSPRFTWRRPRHPRTAPRSRSCRASCWPRRTRRTPHRAPPWRPRTPAPSSRTACAVLEPLEPLARRCGAARSPRSRTRGCLASSMRASTWPASTCRPSGMSSATTRPSISAATVVMSRLSSEPTGRSCAEGSAAPP